MAIKNEIIEGTKIINEIQSSNLKKTVYDVNTQDLICEFNNGSKYEYKEVPHSTYTKFRKADSQGKFFMAEIAQKFKFKKL